MLLAELLEPVERVHLGGGFSARLGARDDEAERGRRLAQERAEGGRDGGR